MASPSALTFPPETFAKLCPAPYLVAHLKPTNPSTAPCRPSGRAPNEARQPTANTSSLTHSDGSAVIRCGNTAVVCGVRAEILYVRDVPHPVRRQNENDTYTEIEELGLLIPNLELSTGCSPAHLPGAAPSPLAQSLSQRLLSLLHISRLVNSQDLRIEGQEPATDDDEPISVIKAYWALYIDVLVMSLDGNAFDCAWAAVVAALRDTKLPSARWDRDTESIICTPKSDLTRPLHITSLPIAASFAIFSTADPAKLPDDAENWILADPDTFEEQLCDENLTIVVDGQRNILRIEKSGGPVLDLRRIRDLADDAHRRWTDWNKIIG